jgi:hypothetical protein
LLPSVDPTEARNDVADQNPNRSVDENYAEVDENIG